MTIQTFRYAAAGGANTLLGLIIYYISFTFILKKENLELGFYTLTPHSAALFMTFCVCFPFGFFMMKFVVFGNSTIKGKVQLVRYFMSYMLSLAVNYVLLKLLVEIVHIYAIFAQIISTAVVISISYFIQRHYSFKIKAPGSDITD